VRVLRAGIETCITFAMH